MLRRTKSVKIIVLSIIVAIGIAAVLSLTINMEQYLLDDTSSENSQAETVDPNTKIQNSSVNNIKSSLKEYESNLENSKNVKLMPKDTINKEVLPGHVFGFIPDNDLETGMSVITLSNPDEKLSIRFTSKFSGDLTKLHLRFENQENIKVRVGIQKDIEGFPSGQWMGNSNGILEKLVNSETKRHDTFDFSEKITLIENEIYHIVIEIDEKTVESNFFLITYNANWPFTPFNHQDPDNTWEDKAINTLFFDGISWAVQDKWPIYVIDYSDNASDGQPYSLMAPWIIRESSMVGQTVRPFSSYLVDEFAFVVSLDGNPTDNLYFTIYDAENNILRNGTFATPDELTKKKSWQQVKLTSPLPLESGETYRFVLNSPNTDLKNPYKVFGHEFMLDQTLGYGSINHHLTKSTNGIQWSKWYDADTAFKLITR